jgi:hypothetical protein
MNVGESINCLKLAPRPTTLTECKGKVVPVLNELSTTPWRPIVRPWVVSFSPRPLYHRGKIARYPLNGELNGPKVWSESCGDEWNLLLLPGIEPRYPFHHDADWAIPAFNVHITLIIRGYVSIILTDWHKILVSSFVERFVKRTKGNWSPYRPAYIFRNSWNLLVTNLSDTGSLFLYFSCTCMADIYWPVFYVLTFHCYLWNAV